MNELAPIVLFVYNRPWHTQQTLEALAKNELADQSILYVYCDGPKESSSEEILHRINQTRKIVSSRKWCKEVHIIENNTNKGLADSIVQGVTEIVNRHGLTIVLEDDIVTSVGFLSFMNKALSIYQNDNSVMHISGYSYPISIPNQFFLYPGGTCWGWGTWQRAWKHFNGDAYYHTTWIKNKCLIDEFNFKKSKNLYSQLLQNVSGEKKTWAILWRASIYELKGCTFYPPVSLTRNIGTDGEGTNCEKNDILLSQNIVDFYLPFKEDCLENEEVNKKIYNYYIGKDKKTIINYISKFIQFIKRLYEGSSMGIM